MAQTDDKDLVRLLAVSPEMAKLYNDLRKSERMMANAERIAHFGCWEFDMADPTRLEGNALRWSDEVFRIFGYKPGEIEVTVENFTMCVHPEDRAMVQAMSMEAYQTLTPISFEHRIVRQDGTIRWVHEEAEVSRENISGRILFVTGTVLDITDLKLAELRRSEAVKALVARNADLERLAFIVSHDLRGPMTTILGLSSLLQEEELDTSTTKECIAGLAYSVSKIDDTIKNLKTIFEVSQDHPNLQTYVRFADLVGSVGSVLGLQSHDLLLTTDFTAAEGIESHRVFLQSIFQNLIANSVKFCRPDVRAALHISALRTNEFVIVSFKDNCMGIDLELYGRRVFGMRQRFHDSSDGAGMGLHMVKTQMEALGGTVHVRSKVNVGSEFILEFPI